MILETERLLLRPWADDDAPELYRMAKNPLIGPAAGWYPHLGVEDSRYVIHHELSGEYTFAVTLRETGKPIGSVGLISTTAANGEYEVGYWVEYTRWGQGYAQESTRAMVQLAFSKLGQKRLWCSHFDGNERSRRTMERCGFRFQFKRKEWWDVLGEEKLIWHYALTKEAWEAE